MSSKRKSCVATAIWLPTGLGANSVGSPSACTAAGRGQHHVHSWADWGFRRVRGFTSAPLQRSLFP